MKALLILTLVFSIVGLTHAGLWLSEIDGLSVFVDGNKLTINSTVGITGFAFALMTNNSSPLSNVVLNPGFTAVHDTGYMAGEVYDGISASIGTSVLVTGDIVSFNFEPGVCNIYFVYSEDAFFDASAITIGSSTIYLSNPDQTPGIAGSLYSFVPEPASMVLVGLGGLFIHRKKLRMHSRIGEL